MDASDEEYSPDEDAMPSLEGAAGGGGILEEEATGSDETTDEDPSENEGLDQVRKNVPKFSIITNNAYSRLFVLTPVFEKTKTQAQNSSQKLKK